jgi:hypothetical protein
MLSGVSTNGTSIVQFQLGATSFATSGYSVSVVTGSTNATSTTGFALPAQTSASDFRTGVICFVNLTGNVWLGTLNSKNDGGSASSGAGNITLSGTLDRIRITTVNGTDTFDAGSINILFE